LCNENREKVQFILVCIKYINGFVSVPEHIQLFFGKGGMSAEAYDAPLMRDLWSFKTHYVFVNVGFFGFG
jgi:hypothetical protein